MNRRPPLQKGYVALLAAFVVAAIGIAVATTLLLLGLGASRSGFAIEQSGQAKALATACAEEGLQKIKENTAFTGTGSLSLGFGACSYTVINTGGSNRLVTSIATVSVTIRKTSASVTQINPSITVSSWQEVP